MNLFFWDGDNMETILIPYHVAQSIIIKIVYIIPIFVILDILYNYKATKMGLHLTCFYGKFNKRYSFVALSLLKIVSCMVVVLSLILVGPPVSRPMIPLYIVIVYFYLVISFMVQFHIERKSNMTN